MNDGEMKARQRAAKERANEVAEEQLRAFMTASSDARVLKALRLAIRSLRFRRTRGPGVGNRASKDNKEKTQNDATRRIAKNRAQRWTLAHDRHVMEALKTDEQIAKEIGRSVKAVRVRRCVLNKKSGSAT